MAGLAWNVFKTIILLTSISVKGHGQREDYSLYDYELTLSNDKLAQEGRQQYENLVQYSKLPRYGTCWTEALMDLETGCKDLTEDVQRQLAFTFANCFLKGAGRKAIRCPINSPITECLADADDTSFSAYREFYVHTQNICFFLQSEAWQANTINTISKLSLVSNKVASKLEESGATQDKILSLQKDSYGIQQKIIQQGEVLGLTLQESQMKAEKVIEDFEKSTKEQRLIIHQVFDRIVQIQTSVFGLFSGIDSVIFYTSSLSTSYLVSMPARTRGARIVIFPLYAINMILESRIKRPDMSNEDHFRLELSRMEYNWWILFWRTVTTGLVILTLIFHYIRYVDYNYQTYMKLEQVAREMADMKNLILNVTPSKLSSSNSNFHYHPNARPLSYDEEENYSDSQYDSTFVGSSSESDNDSEGSEDSFMSTISYTNSNGDSLSFNNTAITSPSTEYSLSLNDSTGSFRYNLRSRSRSSTPVKTNPILLRESPKMFEKAVKSYARRRAS